MAGIWRVYVGIVPYCSSLDDNGDAISSVLCAVIYKTETIHEALSMIGELYFKLIPSKRRSREAWESLVVGTAGLLFFQT